jgi:hypothetical protein
VAGQKNKINPVDRGLVTLGDGIGYAAEGGFGLPTGGLVGSTFGVFPTEGSLVNGPDGE